METPDIVCRNCKFWTPKYYGVGICKQEGNVNAKFWINGPPEFNLLTHMSFGCISFQDKDDPSIEMI